NDFTVLVETDAIIICVPTPLDEHRESALSCIRKTGETIKKYLRACQLVLLESITYPCTTEEILLSLLESAPKYQHELVSTGKQICNESFSLKSSSCNEGTAYNDGYMEAEEQEEAKVFYNDPFISKLPKTCKYDYELESVEINKANLRSFHL
ncbi:MAG: hypothetical protein ACM3MI_16240, partial [Clostridiales bacterium]